MKPMARGVFWAAVVCGALSCGPAGRPAAVEPPAREPAPTPASEGARDDGEDGLVEVLVVDLDSGAETVVDAWVGRVIRLGEVDALPYLHRGEERIEHSFQGSVLRVNGRAVGLVVDAGRIPAELVARHRGSIETIRLRGAGELAPETVAAVTELAAEAVALELRWSGDEAPKLDRLAHLGRRLRHVGLSGVAARAETLAVLGRFAALGSLDLARTDVGDGDLRHLAGLVRLRALNLAFAPVGDAGLAHLAGLTELRGLHLGGTGVGDGGLAHLSGLSLRWLLIFHTRVSDAGLAHLSGHSRLGVLGLSGTGVGDEGLAHLSGLSQLWRLYLHETGVGDEAVERFRRAVPGCRVER